MSERLKVGVVGVGYLGCIHARIYARMPDVELVGVVDVDAARVEEIAAKHACPGFTDAEALIGKVDAVSVVVPTTVHRQVAVPYLEAGVPMLLEKPIAPDAREAVAIVETAERGGIILQVGHIERFNSGIMALAERVREPRFIEVHRLSEFVDRGTDVDVVTDLMIHDIDIVLSLVRSKLASVSAMGSPVVTDHIDIANARLEFENGAAANVTASRVSSKKFRRIRIFGDNSYQALNFIDQQIDVVRTGKTKPGERFPEIVSERINVDSRPPLDAELEHFVATVQAGGQPLVTGRDGLNALIVADQVKEKIHACLS